MKEILKQYASYNVWAHQRLLDVIVALPEDMHVKKLVSSFDSLHSTILHVWDAEAVWWQRVKLQERTVAPSENFSGNMKDLANGLLHQSKQWEGWVSAASDLSLDHVFSYQTSKKEQFKQPVFQVALHVFNHSTYHRGQLVAMLRQLGVEKIPATDFSVFSRKK
jgi:uncharacterized damage-inducible protein DinB